jgi:hypothetical protein
MALSHRTRISATLLTQSKGSWFIKIFVDCTATHIDRMVVVGRRGWLLSCCDTNCAATCTLATFCPHFTEQPAVIQLITVYSSCKVCMPQSHFHRINSNINLFVSSICYRGDRRITRNDLRARSSGGHRSGAAEEYVSYRTSPEEHRRTESRSGALYHEHQCVQHVALHRSLA